MQENAIGVHAAEFMKHDQLISKYRSYKYKI